MILALAACGGSKSSSVIDAPSFACGTAQCGLDTQFCMHYASGVAPVTPAGAGCNPVPSACASAITCDCLVAMVTTSCATSIVCAGDQEVGFTLTCPQPVE